MTTGTEPCRSDIDRLNPPAQHPYAASWLNRLMHWVDTLPGPYWLYYTLLAIASVGLNTYIKWRDGIYAPGTLMPIHIVAVVTPFYYLALIQYLNRVALDALAKFHPALDNLDSTTDDLAYRLTVLPARNMLWVTGIGVIYAVAVLYAMVVGWTLRAVPVFTSPLAILVELPLALFSAIMQVGFTYHAIYQLRMVYSIYENHTRIDLYNRHPLYALSALSANTAIGGTLVSYAWLTANNSFATDMFTLVTASLMALLGITVFRLPLQGIHNRLEREKGRVMAAAGQRLRRSTAELNQHIDAQQYDQVAPIMQTVAGLREELDRLDKIPTWPWQPGLLRNVVSAILLPLLLWLLTRVLEQTLAF